jgi:insertion element IS1 protein InsB
LACHERDKKRASNLRKVNFSKLISRLKGAEEAVTLIPLAAELDEQWSFVQNKKNQRWLWLAIGHHTSEALAYTFGDRSNVTMTKLKNLLKPFGINKFYTDHYTPYFNGIDNQQHFPGKRNTQKIERKFLTFRTRIKRLARKSICFSKSEFMHDTVIGMFINYHEFGNNIVTLF